MLWLIPSNSWKQSIVILVARLITPRFSIILGQLHWLPELWSPFRNCWKKDFSSTLRAEREVEDAATTLLHFITFSWRFYPKRLTMSAFNHEGTNPEQESRKYNFLSTLFYLVLKHLEGNKDVSFGLNMIQPHILIDKLVQNFCLDFNIVGWILDK